MNDDRRLGVSERWFRLLLRLYPADFRDEMGEALVETYRERCRAALSGGGRLALYWVWLRALVDSLLNGLGERLRPAVRWRRSRNWGRDAELTLRRLVRAPVFTATMVGTLMVGLGAFAVVYTAVDKVLIEPLPYERPEDLYFVWRDYGPIFDLNRGRLAGTDIVELDGAGGVIEAAVAVDWATSTLSGNVNAEPENVGVMLSSPGFFELLGVQLALGRGFTAHEAGPGRPPLVVLGYDLWRRRFDGDTSVIGSQVLLDAAPFTVIGVTGVGSRAPRFSGRRRVRTHTLRWITIWPKPTLAQRATWGSFVLGPKQGPSAWPRPSARSARESTNATSRAGV